MGMIANMATRYNKSRETRGTLPSGYEGTPSTDFKVPSCGPEDVDRAFFELFDKTLPLMFRVTKDSSEQRRIPVIFSSGERFSVASKREPFRDRNGALILPIISINRSGIEQESTKQAGVRLNELTIKRRLSQDDGPYQSVKNSRNFGNAIFSGPSDGKAPLDFYDATGRNLRTSVGSGNIYEVFVIPMPKYFTLKYEVTLWCQYLQQANDFISAIMGSYLQPGDRTIRINTSKGYWFVAYFETSISQDNNFSDSTDSERLIKVTMNADVPAYLILPEFPGSPNGLRKYVSSPQVEFSGDNSGIENSATIPSGDVSAYTLSEIETADDITPGDAIGLSGLEAAQERLNNPNPSRTSTSVGNQKPLQSRNIVRTYGSNPVTGQDGPVTVTLTESVLSKGEEVIVIDQIVRMGRKA